MSLAESWKKAKKTFEEETGKKKPSEKFLGVFRKGNNIEASAKKCDDSKTAGDLKKALADLAKAASEYVGLLDKAIQAPDTVPAKDKNDYVNALKKLKTSLEAIKLDGAKMEQTLEAAGKKDKIDPAQLKEANQHLEMRLKVAQDTAQLVNQFKKDVAAIGVHIANANKQLEAAKNAGKTSNHAMHMVAVGVIERYVDEVEKEAHSIQAKYDAATKEGSPLMKARLDPSTDKLPEAIKAQYLPKSKAAWAQTNTAAAELLALVKQSSAKVEEVKRIRAEAQAAGSRIEDPQVYIARLTKLHDEVKKLQADTSIQGDRIIKGDAAADGMAKQPPDVRESWCKNQEGQWQRYAPLMQAAEQKLVQMGKQAVALPRGAREDSRIDKLVVDTDASAKQAIAYIQSVNRAGQSLTAKIQRLRAQAASARG